MNYYLTEFDILDTIYEIRNTALTYFLRAVNLLGEGGIFWIALTIVLMIIPKTRRLGFCCAAALAIEALCVNVILKPLINRTRPCYANKSRVIDTIVRVPDDSSFPSGHAGASFAVSTVIARHKLSYGIISLITSVLISFSRLYFYVHYPTDVLTGAMIGIITGVLMDKLVVYLLKKHDEKKLRTAGADENAEIIAEEIEEEENEKATVSAHSHQDG